MIYRMMNKDRQIALVNISKNFIGITEVTGNIPYYIGDLATWIENRTSPVGRMNVDLMLKLAGIRNKEEYLSITHGISLTDTLWFKTLDSNITWDKISPYRNKFSRVISEICLNGNFKYDGNLKSPSPDYKVSGSVDKCWKHVNNGIYLYKTAGDCYSGAYGLRPYMEYYASQVADALIEDKSHFVRYGITVAKTVEGYTKPYVYSPLISSEQVGLLEYCDSKYKRLSLDELDKQVIINSTRDRQILREMLLLDSIILNCDRHDGNYGFLVNNDTYQILGLSPIYDNDCSLGFSVSLKSVDSLEEAYYEAMKKQARAGMGTYLEQARWAMTRQLFNKLLSMRGFKFKRLRPSIDVENDRIEFMEYIVNTQINNIINMYRR